MLLGDIGVGKTSIVRRLVLDTFDADYKVTIGVNLYAHAIRVEIGGKPQDVELVIWDIDGDYGQTIFKQMYIRGASSALIIGDATRLGTQHSMVRLAKGFQGELPGRPFSLALNKADLVQDAGALDVLPALMGGESPLTRTSAKTGFNVAKAFHALAVTAIRRGI